MRFCFFNSLPNGESSNLFILATFSNSSLHDKISSLDKNSYLPTIRDDKVEISVVCLSKL